MQFTITVLLSLFAITGTPVMAAPMPFEGIAVPKPSTPGKNPIKNAFKKAGDGAAACILGAILCGKIAKDAITSGKTPTIKISRDIHAIGNIEARSPEVDYVTIETRDTMSEEEADEEAEEGANMTEEEADEEAYE